MIKGITQTLLEDPEDMAIKNQGIYLLVEDATFNGFRVALDSFRSPLPIQCDTVS